MSWIESLLQLEGEAVSACKVLDVYYVAYRKCAVMIDGHPAFITGKGLTVEEACADYAREINGKTLVFRDCTEQRKEVNVFFIFAE